MRPSLKSLGVGLLALPLTACGPRVSSLPAPSSASSHAPAAHRVAVGFLRPGQEWRSLANNLVIPHEVIQIAAAQPKRVVANLFITESGSLLEGQVREVGQAASHTVRLAGTLGEPGLLATTTVPVTMTIHDVNPTTISVTQAVKGSLLNTFRNQPFHLVSGG
jgi:hypothetical protein